MLGEAGEDRDSRAAQVRRSVNAYSMWHTATSGLPVSG